MAGGETWLYDLLTKAQNEESLMIRIHLYLAEYTHPSTKIKMKTVLFKSSGFVEHVILNKYKIVKSE